MSLSLAIDQAQFRGGFAVHEIAQVAPHPAATGRSRGAVRLPPASEYEVWP